MAIYHCSCKVMSRGSGRSAVAAAAYRSGTKITNEYDGVTHDYTRKSGIVYSEVMLCENAPLNLQDRATLWNEIEKVEKSAKAQLSREYEISIPIELHSEQWIDFAKNLVADLFVSRGMIADFAIHDRENEVPNPHVHIMTTMRPLDVNGQWENKSEQLYLCKNPEGEERAFTKNELLLSENAEWKKQHRYSKDGNPKGKKVYLSEYEIQNNPEYKDYARIKNDRQPKTEKFGRINPTVELWNSEAFLCTIREEVAGKINASLAALGLDERVDHRSYEEQGIDKVPTIHLGVAATAMERKGIETERGNINREIKDTNELIESINAEIEEVELTVLDEEYIYGEVNVQALDEDVRPVRTVGGNEGFLQRGELEKMVIRNIKQYDMELYGLYDTSTLDRLIAQQRKAESKRTPAQNHAEELIRQIQNSFRTLQIIEKMDLLDMKDFRVALEKVLSNYNSCEAQLKEARHLFENAPEDVKLMYQERVSELESEFASVKVDVVDYGLCAKTLNRIIKENKDAELAEQDKPPIEEVGESLSEMCLEARKLMNQYRNEYIYWKDDRKYADPTIVEAPGKLQELGNKFVDKFKEYRASLDALPETKWYSSRKDKEVASAAKAVKDKLHNEAKALFAQMEDMGVSRPSGGLYLSVMDMDEVRGLINDRVEMLQYRADDEIKNARPDDRPFGSFERWNGAGKTFSEYLNDLPEKHKIAVREHLEAFSQRYSRQGQYNREIMSYIDRIVDTLPKSPERLQREEAQRKEQEARRAEEKAHVRYDKGGRDR